MPTRRTVALTVAAIGMLCVPACGNSNSPVNQQDASKSTTWNVVALGDSDTTGEGDPTRLGWVGRYARLLREKLGLNVALTNLADEGKTSDQLLGEVQSDPTTRGAVKEAEIVLIGIGGADLGEGDARLETGQCKAEACYAPDLRRFGRNLDKTASVIRDMRTSKQAVLRAITLPNVVKGAKGVVPSFITQEIGVYQNNTLKRYICCSAMEQHAGLCVDAYEKFNGPHGTGNAYAKGWLTKNPCCYPSGKGQQVIAELVFKSGLEPLR